MVGSLTRWTALVGGVEKWDDGKLVRGYKIFGFPSCVFGWRGRKLFCLVGEEKEMMKNVIYIN